VDELSPVNAPVNLRVEHLTRPLGLGSRRPRLSWQLPAGTAAQRAYQVRLAPGAAAGWVPGGQPVADLGQNINGWTRLGDLGPAGTELTLVHGEALDAAGDVRAHRGVPSRRGRLLGQVAARRRRRPVGGRDHREHLPVPAR
jgi:hypothetical protein